MKNKLLIITLLSALCFNPKAKYTNFVPMGSME